MIPAALALVVSGCVRPAALTRGARRIEERITPAARAFAGSTRRVVQYAGQAADDTALAAKVKAALLMHKGVEQGRIQVSVEEGVVTLTGYVSSSQAKQQAAAAALGTAGVSGVENHLRVRR